MVVTNLENIALSAGIKAEEKERNRIAKDLHDSIGQQLTAIKLYLNAAQNISNNSNRDKFDTIVYKSIAALDEAIIELSNICFNLMPSALNAYGLTYAIKELAVKIKINKKIDFVLKIKPGFPRIDQDMEVSLFRVIQEFVNNSIKHGQASKIQIDIQQSIRKKEIKIILADNGNGFVIKKYPGVKGSGLKNVKSRIEYHSGKINITSKTGKGTQFEITVPLKYQTI